MNKMTLTLLGATVALSQASCNAQSAGFKKLPSSLQYKLVKDAPGRTAQVGDYMEIHLINSFKGSRKTDTVMFDTRKMNNNMPVPVMVQKPSFGGDIAEAFPMLSEGDSIVLKTPIDSVLKMGFPMMAGVEKGKGQTLDYYIKVVKVRTQAEMQKETAEKASKQNVIDDQLLRDYFTKNNIKAQKTASGLYYRIDNPGTGAALQTGQQITMNYTGKLLDGTPFDSNVDPQFGHVSPFVFALGTGGVIKGWDEGIALFKKGGKGVLYIPSSLAYGERSPSPAIPASSVLVFDVEVVDAGAAQPQMQMTAPEGHSEHDGHNH
jgi:FKBP-type peptidyl-prolyl cis-trans isomerase